MKLFDFRECIGVVESSYLHFWPLLKRPIMLNYCSPVIESLCIEAASPVFLLLIVEDT